jgi:SAM-dependent methyltransferase
MVAYYENPSSRAAAYEIVERDDGFIGLSRGPARYFSPYREWPAYEQEALRHVRGRVVDVGCGAGRHSIYLREQGYEVLPIDNSPGAVKVAQLRGLDDARLAGLFDVDRSFGRIDTLLLMGNNFGLFRDRDSCRERLRDLHALMEAGEGDGGARSDGGEGDGDARPDGGAPPHDGVRIIAESLDPYAGGDPDHLSYHERNRGAGRMPGQLRIRIRYKRVIGPWFDYLLVSPTEMAELVAGTGWMLDQVIRGPTGTFVGIIRKAAY